MNATLTDGSGRSSRVKHDNTNRAIGVGVCQKTLIVRDKHKWKS